MKSNQDNKIKENPFACKIKTTKKLCKKRPPWGLNPRPLS